MKQWQEQVKISDEREEVARRCKERQPNEDEKEMAEVAVTNELRHDICCNEVDKKQQLKIRDKDKREERR